MMVRSLFAVLMLGGFVSAAGAIDYKDLAPCKPAASRYCDRADAHDANGTGQINMSTAGHHALAIDTTNVYIIASGGQAIERVVRAVRGVVGRGMRCAKAQCESEALRATRSASVAGPTASMIAVATRRSTSATSGSAATRSRR